MILPKFQKIAKKPVKLHEIEKSLDRRGAPRSANENCGVVCGGSRDPTPLMKMWISQNP